MPSAMRRLNARHFIRLLPIAAICALAILAMPATVFGDPSPSPAPALEPTDSYIVVFNEDEVAHPGRVAQRHAINRDADLSSVYKTAIEGYAAEMTPADKGAIEADPNVAYVVPDAKVEAFSQETPTGLRRIFAEQNPVLDPNGPDTVMVNVDVAIVDSGVDYTHPDLRVVRIANCRVTGHTCVDNAGDDALGHGTHVAGIVGALDNDIGVVGSAPGARLWSAKVLDSKGGGTMGDIIEGMDWVAAHAGAIEVANLSLGCRTNDPECRETREAFETAVNNTVEAGVVVVVAAGNDNWDVNGHGGSITEDPISYPGAFPDAITVSNLADFDGKAGGNGDPICGGVTYPPKDPFAGVAPPPEVDDSLNFKSNYGSAIDIAAPGTCIRSTYKHGGYKRLSGTSMAAPYVSGAAAVLAAEENPSTRKDVLDIRATLVSEGNYDWTDDSGNVSAPGDEIQEPLLDISNEAVFDLVGPGDVGAIGVTSDNSGDLDVYARNGNNEIWRKAYRSNHWGNWFTVASPNNEGIVGAPAAISRRADSTDLFVKGPGGGIGFRNMYKGSWTSWFPIFPPESKAMLSSPAATNRPDIYDGLTMVVRGHDGNVYLKNYWESIPGGWSPWENLGAPAAGTASSPAITMFDETWLHLTVRGADGAIYDKAWGTGEQKWSSWVNLGTGFTSAPAMTTSRSGDEMYLFGVKTDGKLWMRKAVVGTSGWSEWESLGGNVVADPAATSRESHGVSVFVVGLDNKIQERRYTYGGWTNWMRIDDDCPPEACSWDPGGPGTGHAQSIESNDLVTVDGEGTANVFSGYGEGFDLEDPVKSLEGELDSALIDGKGHYLVDVADVDDDDNSDLITVKDEGKVLVHLGTEERTFEAATDTGISLPPVMNGAGNYEPIAVADVTGDGFDDLVAHLGPFSGSIKLYKGQANGKFSTTAVSSLSGTTASALMEGSGYLEGSGYYHLDLADVDADGRADLVSVNTSGGVKVFKGQADGTFAGAVSAATIDPNLSDGYGHEPVGVADVTADGRADLLTLDSSGTLKLWAGKSDATFATATTAYGEAIDSSLIDRAGQELVGLIDFDADGRSDLVGIEDGDLLVYRAQSDGTFAAPVIQEGDISTYRSGLVGQELPAERPFVRRAGCTVGGCSWPPALPGEPVDSDVDGDHRADLVTVDAEGTAHVYKGTAEGIDAENPVSSMGISLDSALLDGNGHLIVDLADVDGDHRSDLVTFTGADGVAHMHLGGHMGRLQKDAALTSTGFPDPFGENGSEPIAVADVNGDGFADLIAFVALPPGHPAAPGFIATRMRAYTGQFINSKNSLVGAVDSALGDGTGHYFLGAADLDGDERADLVSISDGEVQMFAAGSDGSFAAPEAVAELDPIMDDGEGLEPIGLGDVQGDGEVDLLALEGTTLKLFGSLGAGVEEPSTAYAGEVSSSLLGGEEGLDLLGLLDYNGDGRSDLAAIDSAGDVLTYEAETDGTFAAPDVNPGPVPSVRYGKTGQEGVLEKPFLRRAGCRLDGCAWPPGGSAADLPIEVENDEVGSLCGEVLLEGSEVLGGCELELDGYGIDQLLKNVKTGQSSFLGNCDITMTAHIDGYGYGYITDQVISAGSSYCGNAWLPCMDGKNAEPWQAHMGYNEITEGAFLDIEWCQQYGYSSNVWRHSWDTERMDIVLDDYSPAGGETFEKWLDNSDLYQDQNMFGFSGSWGFLNGSSVEIHPQEW